MDTTTIRVSVEDRDRLNELAAQRGISASRVITELIDNDVKQQILDDWDNLRQQDPAGYRDELAEIKAWEPTLADGLDVNTLGQAA